MTVLEPRDVSTLSAMLAAASNERLAVVPQGAGTRRGRGAPPARADAMLSLAGLPRDIEHCSGDLTATLSASVTLGEVSARLAQAGQCLPIDPLCSEQSTIGGMVAGNACGPARHRYGAPRDLIIGVDLALADGRLVKAGGRVVKNVAGYDLARLVCGSFGCLAVVTRATFKLVPLPQAAITMAVTWAGGESEGIPRLAGAALALAAQPITPTAVELDAPVPRLLLRFESTATGADRQASAAARFCLDAGFQVARVDEPLQAAAWRDRRALIWGASSTSGDGHAVLRVAVLPTDIATMLDIVSRCARAQSVRWRAAGHAVLGVFYVALDGPDDAQAGTITAIRRAVEPRRGSAVILAANRTVMQLAGPWGDAGNGFGLMQAVKARFDPNGTLNPGAGPGGL
jgi:glycolate oxidase FAD binding subunit